MENTEHIKIETRPNENGETVVHILHGDLPDPINNVGLSIAGNIFAVEKYVTGKDYRKQEIKQIESVSPGQQPMDVPGQLLTVDYVSSDDTYIIVNDEEKTINLLMHAQHPHAIKVLGKLEKTAVFKEFGIEIGKRWSINSLKQFIRVNRPYFTDKDQHAALLTNLGRTDLTVNQIIKEHNDDRGNINQVLEQKVISNINENFTLEIGIFKGMPAKKFLVNVLMDVRDKGVSVWLESVEALELMKDQWETERARQIEIFEGRGFTVITQ